MGKKPIYSKQAVVSKWNINRRMRNHISGRQNTHCTVTSWVFGGFCTLWLNRSKQGSDVCSYFLPCGGDRCACSSFLYIFVNLIIFFFLNSPKNWFLNRCTYGESRFDSLQINTQHMGFSWCGTYKGLFGWFIATF